MIESKARPRSGNHAPFARGAVAMAGFCLIGSICGCQEDRAPEPGEKTTKATTFFVSGTGIDPVPFQPAAFPGTAVVEIRSNATLEDAGTTRQSDLPPVRIELAFEAPSDAGVTGFSIQAVAITEDATIGPREEALMSDLAEQDVRVLRGVFQPETPERSASVSLPTPAAASPAVAELLRQVEQALSTVTVPIPREPIGGEASWRSTRSISIAGVTWDQVLECDTARREANATLIVTVESDLHAAPQTYSMNGLPAGDRAEIIDARAKIRGTWEGESGAPLPSRANLSMESELKIRVHHDGDANELHLLHNSSIRFESAPPDRKE